MGRKAVSDMASCYKDCIHCFVCQYVNHEEYPTVQQLKDDCRNCLTATDVVPRSEVVEMQKEQLGKLKEIKSEIERVIVEYEAMRGAANSYKMHYEQAKAEVASEIFEEIDRMIFGTIIPNDCAIISIAQLAKFKKKYTEGET
jgi:Na+-translocating ferredoxin:NAD+ oxidoreductase RnfC subunit